MFIDFLRFGVVMNDEADHGDDHRCDKNAHNGFADAGIVIVGLRILLPYLLFLQFHESFLCLQ